MIHYTIPQKGPQPLSHQVIDGQFSQTKLTCCSAEAAEAEASFTQLIEALASTGFATEVRNGNKSSILVFVKLASDRLLKSQVYRTRVQDWYVHTISAVN